MNNLLGWLKGYCLDRSGADQNTGQIQLGDTFDTADECLTECKKNKKATGCEFSKRISCIAHTKDVAAGSRDSGYQCMVFSSKPEGKDYSEYIIQLNRLGQ